MGGSEVPTCLWLVLCCPLLNNVEIALLGVGPFLSFNQPLSFFTLQLLLPIGGYLELQEYLDQIL